ncbi:tetratricopeptide repeat protein [Candidatus Binatia bacterium]|nr:tetratricopeptide repeat protein [Candidatus Binatia bacterium]
MISRRRLLWVVLLPLAAVGCATRADYLQIKQELRETRALVADQQVAIDGLRRRMEILRGDMGGGRAGSGAPSGTVLQRMNSLDARVTALEDRRGVIPPTPTATETPLANETPPGAEAATPEPTPIQASGMDAALNREEAALPEGQVENEYREALGLVRERRCNQAVPKLRDLIRRNPKNAIADNAQYWIGSCYYSQRDYSRAIIELNDLVLKYPKGDRVPAALLLMADAFADSGDKIDARLVLQKLISQHGSAPEAEQARRKLQALGD